MEKTKLLTSLAAFVLVLSLGACSEPEEDDVTSQESSESVETTESEADTEQEPEDLTGPAALLDLAGEGNYTMSLRIDTWVSDDVSVEDFGNENYDEDELFESMTWGGAYIYTIYYTDEAILCELSLDYGYYTIPYQSILYINDYDDYYGDVMWCFVSYYGGAFSYYGLYYGPWQSIYRYAADFVDEGLAHNSSFELLDSGTTADGVAVDLYDVASDEVAFDLSLICGLDWAYSDAREEAGYLTFFGIYYYPELVEMDAFFAEAYWDYNYHFDISSWSYVIDSYYIEEDDLTASFTNVGTTDLSETIDACMASLEEDDDGDE